MVNNAVRYTFKKRGIYYFVRRVPQHVRGQQGPERISFSLNTRSAETAASRVKSLLTQLDEAWFLRKIEAHPQLGRALRRESSAVVGRERSAVVEGESSRAVADGSIMSCALQCYLHQKGRNRSNTFHTAAERACGYFIAACGDKPLAKYTRLDAKIFRDSLVTRGLAGSSIARNIGAVNAVINFTIKDDALPITNPLQGVQFDREAGVQKRLVIPTTIIHSVQQRCFVTDDELRWLIALVSDTGLRLAEAAGLNRADIHLEATCPLLTVRPHLSIGAEL